MTIRELKSGACSFESLPEDVFLVITRPLSPTDICNLSLCCKSLCELVDSEKIWLVQCQELKALPLSEIVQWRKGISSYKALCRFLVEVMKPLVGIWVYQNPELGNVVCVMPGFLSVVGCRIIPQEVDGPLGIQDGRVLWSPVFEIICGFDGSPKFFLHGRGSHLYPGFVTGIEKSCNVLLLQVESWREKDLCNDTEGEVSFEKLTFRYRRELLDIVTSHVGLHVSETLIGKLFPTVKDDEAMLLERRTMLLKMHKFGGDWERVNLEEDAQLSSNPMLVDVKELRGNDMDSQKFLNSGDTFGLSLKASDIEISSYKGWPIMRKEHYGLCKLPIKDPVENQEYAGLWGGTFGWPPGKSTEHKYGNAFFLLMLSYDNSREDSDKRLLIGTKILEGTSYVNHPNGSVMFAVDINEPSLEPFPFDADGRNFERSCKGKGIGSGYGFRYPGLKPVQRLNLEEILKKGLGTCVPPLHPTMNFTYMERSYRNVFTEISTSSSSSE